MASLYDKLLEYSKSDIYPFHMPGHKRQVSKGKDFADSLDEILNIDITEVSGFDNLHEAKSILKEAQDRAARLYGADHTYFLINGSTVGILCAISAVSKNKDTIIIGRNSHKSVYNAAYLNKLSICCVYPKYSDEYDINLALEADKIEEAIKESIYKGKRIAAVVITSPTYEGIVSDIEKIASVVHEYGLPLIVDEAHGAHFGFGDEVPVSSVRYADLVIHSVHKTLMAPTQTALLHLSGSLVDRSEVQKYIDIYETSSPSYILMAGIDRSIRLMEEDGQGYIRRLSELRKLFDEKLKDLKLVKIVKGTEIGKIVISVKGTNYSGRWLFEKLRDDYGLELEMSTSTYALAMLTIMDNEDGMNRLASALLSIDKELKPKNDDAYSFIYPQLSSSLDFYEAYDREYEYVLLENAENETVAEYINLYPPGCPIAIPGEIITRELIEMVKKLGELGFSVQGFRNNKVKVVKYGEADIPDGEEFVR